MGTVTCAHAAIAAKISRIGVTSLALVIENSLALARSWRPFGRVFNTRSRSLAPQRYPSQLGPKRRVMRGYKVSRTASCPLLLSLDCEEPLAANLTDVPKPVIDPAVCLGTLGRSSWEKFSRKIRGLGDALPPVVPYTPRVRCRFLWMLQADSPRLEAVDDFGVETVSPYVTIVL